jgi:hypothetical protein
LLYTDSCGIIQGKALADYVQSVVQDEWITMERGHMSEKTQERFNNVRDKLHLLKPENKASDGLYIAVAGYLSEASQHRLTRARLLEGNLYPPVWVIIVFGFITIVFGLYYNHIQQTAVRVIFDFMVLFILLSCIYFIYDISTPFSGYVVVKPEVFEKIQATMLALP